MAKYVLLDTGFWYAFYDARDTYHKEATDLVEYIMFHRLIIPWPCLYENLNTRFVRRVEWLKSFRGLIRRPNVEILNDEPYREHALASVLEAEARWLNHSLVDEVIREILRDESIRLEAVVTFNRSDFADLCEKRRIEIVGDS
jgi:predicted nucleic acid-binding protein